MSVLFNQSDFSGGLNRQLDATKIPANAYPLLVNGRIRENIVSPTPEHKLISAPVGNYQNVSVIGSFLLVVISGVAYYADIEADPIIFYPVSNWTPMDASVSRIYTEPVPATSNLFNQAGTPQNMVKTFNSALAIFKQGLFAADGLNTPQAVLPDGSATPLGRYATWTKDNPLYVPVGVLPSFAGAKLYLVAPTLDRIYQSVSGRASDFVVNLDAAGDKGGDVDTVSQTVSLNPITAMRGLSTGEVLVGTLYGTHVLELDFNNLIFGEPYLQPRFLFPAGPVNELSIIDILSDTAMITQSGIHSFNAVAQAKRESNNFPFGARIRGLLTNPVTKKAIVQENTCAGLYDDYAFFAVNTVYGHGVIVYDTVNELFHSVDLSFGRVKQFASTKINGNERLFYITHDNQLYEAFGGENRNVTRLYLGEFTPPSPDCTNLTHMVDMSFSNMKSSGYVKVTFFADQQEKASVILEATAAEEDFSLPIPIPYPATKPKVYQAGFQFRQKARAWRSGVMIEWNFDGDLTAVSCDSETQRAENVRLDVVKTVEADNLLFFADTGYQTELNPGGNFPAAEFVMLDATKGDRYVFLGNNSGIVSNGNMAIESGVFKALYDKIIVKGTAGDPMTFKLRNFENFMKVLDAMNKEENITAFLHGGDFAYNNATEPEVELAMLPINRTVYYTAGNHDIVTDHGKYFYGLTHTARYGVRDFEWCSIFFFNSSGYEPDGIDSTSVQAGYVKNWLATNTKKFKFIVTHKPPYSNDTAHYHGLTDIRYLMSLPGVSGLLCGHAHEMEYFADYGAPLFICGTGGSILREFITGANVIPYSWHLAGTYGYLKLSASPVSAVLEYKDTDGNTLKKITVDH